MKKKNRIKEEHHGPIKSFVFRHFLTCVFTIVALFTFLAIMIERSMTLLPVCIYWKDVQVGIILLSAILAVVKNFRFKSSYKIMEQFVIYFAEISSFCIITLACVFLPNRYIHKEEPTTYYGLIIDTTKEYSKAIYNFAKIKLNGEDTCLWYETGREAKPVGTRCILTIGRGIFNLRYVQDVDFIVQ